MKVLLTTPGRFHTFALARELLRRDRLLAIVTGFPWEKVARERLPRDRVKTFPLFTLLFMGLGRLGVPARLLRPLDDIRRASLDGLASLWADRADVFVGLSGSGLATGQRVQRNGGVYICDRGSSHILYQKRLLEEEARLQGTPSPVFNPAVVKKELAEYAAADAITVPSEFVRRSFLAEGVPEAKIHKIPYGVDLSRFRPGAPPEPGAFEVLFVGGLSARKGLPYLFSAFAALKHPNKRLTLAGMPTADFAVLKPLAPEGARFLSHVRGDDLTALMSSSHTLVLPSVEDGFGLVMAEAMACGCPVIASGNTGASDLYTDGVEGFITPPRDVEALTGRLQALADDPARRDAMSAAALARVAGMSGWSAYGDRMTALLEQLVAARRR